MEHSSTRGIRIVALAQVIPLLLFPWDLSVRSFVFIAVLILLAAFLGWALLQRKPWGRLLTIFVQGMNIIVRIITLFGNVYSPEAGVKFGLLVTYVLSAVASGVLLSYIDRPETQLVFES
jgi:hypothetical protein